MLMFSYGHSATTGSRFGTLNDFNISLYICNFKCILLTVPCLSEATGGGEPGARSLPSLLAALILLLLLLLLSKLNRILEGLNMLEKSGNFAHASELVKIYV